LDLGIEAVVELAAEEAPVVTPRELVYCRFPLIDGGGNRPELLGLAGRTVAGVLAAGGAAPVCCGARPGPAAGGAAGAPAGRHGEPPESCLLRVTAHHPADVAPRLWADLLEVWPQAQALASA